MNAEYEFWPRWKPLPDGYEKMPTGHTERAILVRRKADAQPPQRRRRRKEGEDGKPAA